MQGPSPRYLFSSCVLSNGDILIWGGFTVAVRDDMHRFRPVEEQWEPVVLDDTRTLSCAESAVPVHKALSLSLQKALLSPHLRWLTAGHSQHLIPAMDTLARCCPMACSGSCSASTRRQTTSSRAVPFLMPVHY